MQIKCVKVGDLQTNCYVLSINNKCIIIDPGDNYEKIKSLIDGSELKFIILTHSHYDHIGALKQFTNEYNVPIYNINNLTEKKYKIDDFNFEVIYTKGHTNDSISIYFYNEKIMFTGDFLFKNTIGRTDLPSGNFFDMKESLKKIKNYQDDIKLYPGHGEFTTLGIEKIKNQFLK